MTLRTTHEFMAILEPLRVARLDRAAPSLTPRELGERGEVVTKPLVNPWIKV